jgi:hypothetical protein
MEERIGPTTDRRASARKPYPLRHRIAVYHQGARPNNLSYHWVRCSDFSAGGFSYWSDSPPRGPDVVLDLTGRDKRGIMLAHVRNVRRVGEARYLVGCQFVRRIG